MKKKPIEEAGVHPLIAIQEELKENTVEFRGFLGTGNENIVCLYPELSDSTFLEISKDAILHWEKDGDGEIGKIRVYVVATAQVREFNRRRIEAQGSTFAFTNTEVYIDPNRIRFPPFIFVPPPVPSTLRSFWECVAGCESSFVPLANEIHVLQFRITREIDPMKLSALITRKDNLVLEASNSLNFCLSQCPNRPFFINIHDIFQEIWSRYLGNT